MSGLSFLPKSNSRDFYSAYYAAKGGYVDYMKEVEEWNVNHGKKNENTQSEKGDAIIVFGSAFHSA